MSLVAPVEDGKIVQTTSQSSLSGVTSSSGDMDKDSFLQLLVAQMKYQDPLEPTSNTEYISQYAQFTQVEQMQNMASSMDLMRASGLVGQEVYMKVTSSTTGETSYVNGKVDYVVYEGGKAYVSINESLYALDDLDTILDEEYAVAYEMASELLAGINKLPSLNNVTDSDISTIEALNATYEGMDDYQKSFVTTENVVILKAYLAVAEGLKAKQEETPETPETPETGSGDES
ncbi:MAG: flagellar hook capping protein [Lachnospiraceae bacterium]|nr:flagellar hook capping protein [Lachnospiraceae bacterium]